MTGDQTNEDFFLLLFKRNFSIDNYFKSFYTLHLVLKPICLKVLNYKKAGISSLHISFKQDQYGLFSMRLNLRSCETLHFVWLSLFWFPIRSMRSSISQFVTFSHRFHMTASLVFFTYFLFHSWIQ